MPLNSSLIRGAKFVWGKTQLQFGKQPLLVFFEQNHKQKCGISGVVQYKILIFCFDYDSDRHFSYPSILETNTILQKLSIY
jgi:hypothetical protein